MNWTWTHTMWAMVLAPSLEVGIEALQGQPLNAKTVAHAGAMVLLAVCTLAVKSWKTPPAPPAPPAA